MPQLCKICNHSEREKIETLLIEGWPSLREIGVRFGVSKDSLFRHSREHLGTAEEEDEEVESQKHIAPASAEDHHFGRDPCEMARCFTSSSPIW